MISKRAIPRIAVAGLVLGGCGEDEISSATIAKQACNGVLECDPTFFYSSFESMDECRDRVGGQHETSADFYFEKGGGDCEDAFLEYYDCYFADYGSSCSIEHAGTSCYELAVRFDDLCF